MADTRFDVAGIGNAIVDVIAEASDTFLNENGIARGGMTLIDEARATELYGLMPPALEASGGSCGNTIAGVASLGGRGAYFGKVRDDQLGDVFTHDIRSLGVAFETERATQGPATARCLILVTPDAQRSMSTYLGACVGLGPDDIDEEVIAASAITYMEGYLWDPEGAKQAFLKASAAAHKAGRKVSISLSDSFCVDRHRDDFLRLVRHEVDILFANESEILSLYQVEDFEEALSRARKDCRYAALTRSEAGSVIIADGEVHKIEAVRPERLLDTTGAGDLYASGVLYGIARGLDPVRLGKLGSLAASEAISHFGPRPQASLKALAGTAGLL